MSIHTIRSIIELHGTPPTVFEPSRMLNGRENDPRNAISVVSAPITIASNTIESTDSKVSAINRLHGLVPLTVEINRGNRSVATLHDIPFHVNATKTGEITLDSERQNTPWRFLVKVSFARREMSLSFLLDYSGLTVEQALEGVRFNQELSHGGEFIVVGRQPITGAYMRIARGNLPLGTYEAQDARFVEMLNQLAFIQDKTRVRFTIPSHSITFEEWASITAVSQILKSGRAAYQAEPWVTLSSKQQASDFLESFEGGEAVLTTVQFNNQEVVIFGTRFSLGPVILFSDRTRITKEDLDLLRQDVESASPSDSVKIRFTPDKDRPIDARYFDWLSADESIALQELLEPRNSLDLKTNSRSSDIVHQISVLVELAKDEIFEDGLESEFTKGLYILLKTQGDRALAALISVVEDENVNEEIAAEILLWLGRQDHESSHQARLNLLERCLQSDSARVRDAASVALASMDDPNALPALKLAIGREKYSDLRDDMRQVLAQLESAH